MHFAPAHRTPRHARGFTLVEIVVVLFILGIVITMAVAITNALTSSQRLSITTTRLAAIDTAMVQYVMQQKRLPCPRTAASIRATLAPGWRCCPPPPAARPTRRTASCRGARSASPRPTSPTDGTGA